MLDDWLKIIETKEALREKATPRAIAVHTGLREDFVARSLVSEQFLELQDAWNQERLSLWAGVLNRSKADFNNMMNELVPLAILKIKKVIMSGQDKDALKAAHEVLSRATNLEQPVERKEVVHRFSATELEDARKIAREISKPVVTVEAIEAPAQDEVDPDTHSG